MAQIAITPSALNKYLKSILDNDKHLKFITIKGEISNLKYHSNGNIYFSIKDELAQVNCLMFSNYTKKLNEKFQEGDEIELNGSLYLYVKGGQYSINVYDMKKQGIGDLAQKFNQLKTKLEKEGLFSNENKKSIPDYPTKIGVITAPTGAAIKDILITLKNRYPLAKVTVYPAIVQGKNSAADLVKKLRYADKDHNDVIIMGRGGGSIEDLWSFNEEIVAYEIYNSQTPIISSVGHETDFTISDFVADIRAATPTAAAQIATPEISNIKSNIISYKNSLNSILTNKINTSQLKLNNLVQNQYFVNPLTTKNISYDQLSIRFNSIIKEQSAKLNFHMHRLDNLQSDLINYEKSILKQKKTQLDNIHTQLDNLNPLQILSRGYSVTSINNKAINDVSLVNDGDILITKLNNGKITSTVQKKEYDE